jgi:hypothetical protein
MRLLGKDYRCLPCSDLFGGRVHLVAGGSWAAHAVAHVLAGGRELGR